MSSKEKKLVIFGAWYFSDVIEELAEMLGWEVLGRVDPDPPKHRHTLKELPEHASCFVAIGDNGQRQYVSGKLLAQSRELTVLVHPSASVSPGVDLRAGTYIGENVSIRTGARMGTGVVINSNSVVSHHVAVGDYVTFGPNCAVASKSVIGKGSLLGVGSCARPSSVIGEYCTVGAGSVVTKPVEDGTTVLGNPANLMSAESNSTPPNSSNWVNNTIW